MISAMLLLGLGSISFLVYKAPDEASIAGTETPAPVVSTGEGAIPPEAISLAKQYVAARLCSKGSLDVAVSQASTILGDARRLQPANDTLTSLLGSDGMSESTTIYELVLEGSCPSADVPGRTFTSVDMLFVVDSFGSITVPSLHGTFVGDPIPPFDPFGPQFEPCQSDAGCAEPRESEGTS
jgi:hypothetical protein